MEVALSAAYSLGYVVAVLVVSRCLRELTLLKAIPIATLLTVGVNAVGFVLLGLFGVGYSIPLSLGFNLVVVFAGLRFGERTSIGGKDAILRMLATKYDVVAWVAMGALVVAFFLIRFGMPPRLLFASGDAATHYQLSCSLFDGGIARSLCGSYLFAAMVMSSLSGFFGSDNLPALFVVSETLMFYLGGLCFYTLVAYLFPRTNKAGLSIILSVLYMCGMPMNTLILGFSYLSFSVVAITGILLFMARVQGGNARLFDYISLSLLLFEVVINYSLFVPPVYLAVFVCLVVVAYRNKQMLKSTVQKMAIVFLLPVLFGCVLVYLAIFGAGGTAAIGVALNRNGGTFVETYGQYLIFLPLILYGVYCAYKQKQMFSANVIFGVFMVFTLILGVLLIADRVSAYYFSKTSNILWLGAFLYIACGFNGLLAKSRALVVSFVASYLLMLALFVSGIDQVLVERGYNTQPIGKSVFPIYAQNKAWLRTGSPSSALLEAYEVLNSYSQSEADGDEVVIGIVNHGDTPSRWFGALHGKGAILPQWGYTDDDFLDVLKRQDYVFLGAEKGGFPTKSGTSYDELREEILASGIGDVVFSNESGAILKMNE